jgi:protein tyrosine phosphatase (PTP) superfamily phosphohydrolase (DUF442 family)
MASFARHARGNALMLVFLGLAAAAPGCQREAPGDPLPQPVAAPQPIQAGGLHNVFRLSDKLYSGSGPETEADFRALEKLGVKTVISVDGARPDVETAKKCGLRYIHLPIGYDGMTRERALQLAKAVQDSPGPVYLHCHHGKHRGPAAAAAVMLCLDERCTVEQAEAFLKMAGTDPAYKGLVGLPRSLVRPSAAELGSVKGDFPETAPVADLTRLMVEIDTRFDHLKLAHKAGWKAPADHPDLDPPHEARMLLEQYREAARLKSERPAEFQQWLTEAADHAAALEKELRSGVGKQSEELLGKVRADCTRCHAKYRDVPR